MLGQLSLRFLWGFVLLYSFGGCRVFFSGILTNGVEASTGLGVVKAACDCICVKHLFQGFKEANICP